MLFKRFVLPACLLWCCTALAAPDNDSANDFVIVSGTVTDEHGKGVPDADLQFFMNGKLVETPEEVVTHSGGTYDAELEFPAGVVETGRL